MEIGITALIVLLATVLLVVEVVFVPGFGFTGVAGVLTMVGAVLYAFFAIGNLAGWVTLIAVGLICVALFLWALYGNSLDKVALKKNITSTVQEIEMSKFSVGDRGVTKTRLALIGEAEINGYRVEVKSETGFINEGVEVEIARISGDSLFVKNVD